MSGEKTNEVLDETHHGISVDHDHDPHYPVVAEGTGKTLDTAAGAKAREVHNVSCHATLSFFFLCPQSALSIHSRRLSSNSDVIIPQAELFAAIQESKIKRWSKESIQIYYAVFIAFCCACANGYDGSLIGSITAMQSFMDTFHTELTGSKVSIISSLYSV